MRQSRIIELDGRPPDATQFRGSDQMLVHVYRDEFTDVICIEIHMGSFDFELRTSEVPTTREQAVSLARDFIQNIEFIGRVQWRLGNAGPIPDEAKL